MSTLRFLCDEDTHVGPVAALRRAKPSLDVLHVGKPGAPVRGTLDPDLLIVAEASGRCLISRDRKTMPDHLTDHWAAGHHTWGMILIRRNASWPACIQDILLIWQATTAEEWVDRTDYIPY